MKAPIQIRREDVAEDIRKLAGLMKVSLTEAVAVAVRERLEEAERQRRKQIEERDREIQELLKAFWALPKTGPLLTDADLYDEDGLPKSPWS